MCDTFVCPPHLSATGNWIFGKNSDREPNEIQLAEYHPPAHKEDISQRCTYISVEHTRDTYGVILSRPYWMWGAEMSINEKGVAIGNEAVFTRLASPKKNQGLTGMDMLRLALESCATAQEAVEKIIDLNQKYGQDGNGGYHSKFYYFNSFIIADAQEAFVLETVGKFWAVEQVRAYRAISNGLTIGSEYDEIHPETIDFARRKSWTKKREEFNFSKAFSSYWMPKLSGCRLRKSLIEKGQKDSFTVLDAFEALRSHDRDEEDFMPNQATTGSVCMHASGLFSPQQTTASMVVEIRKSAPPTAWLTGSSSPCLSVFTPFYIETELLIDSRTHWIKWEQWHRTAIHDYKKALSRIQSLRNCKEDEWVNQDKVLIKNGNKTDRDSLSRRAWSESDKILNSLLSETYQKHTSYLYRALWKRHHQTKSF